MTGIIGHAAIQKPFHDTEFLNEDYLELSNIFSGKSIPDIADMLGSLFKKKEEPEEPQGAEPQE